MASNQNIIKLYLDSLAVEKNVSKHTLSAYKTDIAHFAQFLINRKPSINLDIANEIDVLDYLKALSTKYSLSKKTQARRVSSIKSFYLFCYQEKLMQNNPTLAIKSPKLDKNLPKFLSKDQMKDLLLVIKKDKNPMFYIMLEVLYASGMRVSELVSLKISSLIEDNSFLLINGKGDKERIVPLTKIASNYLVEWKNDRYSYYKIDKDNIEYFFPSNSSQSGHITRERFAQVLKKYALNANLDYNAISPHIVRHSFATHILNNGGDLKSIQDILGHSDISTTEIYTHILDENLQNSVYKNHPLSKKLTK